MPSAAERTRTLVQSTCSAVLLVPGLEATRPELLCPEARSVAGDGDVHLVFPADAPAVRAATHAQDGDIRAVLELTDVAPVSVPHRIRGRAWLSGWITVVPGTAEPGRATVRLELDEVTVDDLWGAQGVDPDAFAAASPDPLAAYETELLQHLHSGHGDQVRRLWRLLGEHRDEPGPDDRAVPLALDRFGLRVRFTRGGATGSPADRSFDARFEFPEPADDLVALRRAMHRLFDATED
ncbi:DUF2470 domain-containing protein [Streptomyces caatingaensis]|uniref:DUF2470 domain-containing protein n=1 Tax=Streptomyces caatingaensis TaxID=1678637 RepID=A0A0K9X9G6_9ACTN|nr:DUF2470 domain-containing protein [Streptomyces caatingaensis]KNB49848.1 hypothetical protein AC230_24165 [Streptomyces caatingaensis]